MTSDSTIDVEERMASLFRASLVTARAEIMSPPDATEGLIYSDEMGFACPKVQSWFRVKGLTQMIKYICNRNTVSESMKLAPRPEEGELRVKRVHVIDGLRLFGRTP